MDDRGDCYDEKRWDRYFNSDNDGARLHSKRIASTILDVPLWKVLGTNANKTANRAVGCDGMDEHWLDAYRSDRKNERLGSQNHAKSPPCSRS